MCRRGTHNHRASETPQRRKLRAPRINELFQAARRARPAAPSSGARRQPRCWHRCRTGGLHLRKPPGSSRLQAAAAQPKAAFSCLRNRLLDSGSSFGRRRLPTGPFHPCIALPRTDEYALIPFRLPVLEFPSRIGSPVEKGGVPLWPPPVPSYEGQLPNCWKDASSSQLWCVQPRKYRIGATGMR